MLCSDWSPDHLVAGDVLHLQQSVDHGQLVSHRELLIHVDVGLEHGALVEFIDDERLAELGGLQSEELCHGPVIGQLHTKLCSDWSIAKKLCSDRSMVNGCIKNFVLIG